MIFKMKILLLVSVYILAVTADDPDLISWLPGLIKQPSFSQYAGYLNGTGQNSLHYWFVESQYKPATDPVLIWFNGGPGCSSLYGLLSENGPFLINDDGVNLSYNPYSWNTHASVLYIESPPGTGFSYAGGDQLSSSDDKVTEDHYAAIQHFFVKFPALLKTCPVFLAGQSYAGVYIPLLAMKLQDMVGLDFRGLALGSPCSSLSNLDNSLMYYAYNHGIIGAQLWGELNSACCQDGTCNFHDNNKTACVNAVNQAFYMINELGLNPFNIYQDCAGGIPPPGKMYKKSSDGRHYYPGVFKHMYSKNDKVKGWWKGLEQTPLKKLISGIPCMNTSAITTYLNNPYVKSALHVMDGIQDWKPYNPEVDQNYTRQYPEMSDTFIQILRTFKYRILIYSGDCDAVCNFLGNEWFVNSFQLEEEVQWRAWLFNPGSYDQIAGFVKEYDNMAFVTVKGAGHYAPADKPRAMQQLIYNFINKRPF